MKKYLYFTHRDDVSSIMKSSLIDNRKSKFKNTGNIVVLDSQNKPVVAFVYNVEKITKSKCYITYPLDGTCAKPVIFFKKFLGIPLIPSIKIGFRIPTQLRAITFDIKNENDLVDWFLSDKNVVEKLYCESVSIKPLGVCNIEIVDTKEALKLIGLAPPYIHYIDFIKEEKSLLISKDYIIGH